MLLEVQVWQGSWSLLMGKWVELNTRQSLKKTLACFCKLSKISSEQVSRKAINDYASLSLYEGSTQWPWVKDKVTLLKETLMTYIPKNIHEGSYLTMPLIYFIFSILAIRNHWEPRNAKAFQIPLDGSCTLLRFYHFFRPAKQCILIKGLFPWLNLSNLSLEVEGGWSNMLKQRLL